MGIALEGVSLIQQKGFLYDFDLVVWSMITMYAIGNLSSVICIKYTDNIAKNFVTSFAVILSTVVYFIEKAIKYQSQRVFCYFKYRSLFLAKFIEINSF